MLFISKEIFMVQISFFLSSRSWFKNNKLISILKFLFQDHNITYLLFGFRLINITGVTMNLRQTLSKKLTKKEMESLKTSFDIIGDIAIIEIPPEQI